MRIALGAVILCFLPAVHAQPEGDRFAKPTPIQAAWRDLCDARIRATWFWKTNNQHTLKSLPKLMEMYERSVGHGAVLLLNNTPDRTGLIPEPDAKRSAEFGAEIKKRYGTPVAEASGRGRETVLELKTATAIDRAVLMEDTTQGERVRRYVLEGRVDGQWKQLVAGTATGHKKIDRFAAHRVEAVRLCITESVGEPLVRRLAVFAADTP